MAIHSFEQAVQLLNDRINLEHLQDFTSQDLENRLGILQEILTSLGNPETTYRAVHVAGTKGKGSTCVILESMLLKEGWRVGRYTSPHNYSFLERLAINGVSCPPDDFTELFFSVYERIEPDTLQLLTYFELLTLLAFVYFARQKVDIAIFEVGLGGKHDATNLCRPDVSIITSISYDHMQQLGPSLSAIAAEKSGIIKPDVPVVTTVLHPEPQNVIRDRTQSIGAPLFVLDEHFFIRPSSLPKAPRYTFRYDAVPPDFPVEFSVDAVTLKMQGAHQIRNASAALSAFLLLHQGGREFDAETMRSGLHDSFLPLRGEMIHPTEASPTIIFDGAHNRSPMRAFLKMVTELFPKQRHLLVFGVSLGKDVEGMFAEISGRFHHIFLTQSSNVRRFPPQGLRSILALQPDRIQETEQRDEEDYLDLSVGLQPESSSVITFPVDIEREMKHITVAEDCKDALTQCLQMATPEDVVCIAGSLYLAAELREVFLAQGFAGK